MTYVCNKCGYCGPISHPHDKYGVKGALCHYAAVPAPEPTPEERTEIIKRFGLDDSQEQKAAE